MLIRADAPDFICLKTRRCCRVGTLFRHTHAYDKKPRKGLISRTMQIRMKNGRNILSPNPHFHSISQLFSISTIMRCKVCFIFFRQAQATILFVHTRIVIYVLQLSFRSFTPIVFFAHTFHRNSIFVLILRLICPYLRHFSCSRFVIYSIDSTLFMISD